MSKIEGLKVLKKLDIPSVNLIDHNLLDENSGILKEGLSVRVSPKKDTQNNVYLPSIHNCKDLKQIREFIENHKDEYYIIVHKTVKPELLGSVSKYQMSPEQENMAIELFEDFEKRKNGQIKNRVIVPVMGERIMASQMQMKEKDKNDFLVCSKVIREAKELPFQTYDAEFVVENGDICFTDLTIQSQNDMKLVEEQGMFTKRKSISNDGCIQF